MVDIHSATAEIRRGKKDRRRKKPQGKNIMGGHNSPTDYSDAIAVTLQHCTQS